MEIFQPGQLSELDTRALVTPREGRRLDKQDVVILILSGIVLLIGILVGIMTITSDLLNGLDADQASTKNGRAQTSAWLAAPPYPNLDQQPGGRPTSADLRNRMPSLRQ